MRKTIQSLIVLSLGAGAGMLFQPNFWGWVPIAYLVAIGLLLVHVDEDQEE